MAASNLSNSRRYYVYHLIDPRDGEVFYVGKGSGNRLHQHELDARFGRITNYYKHRRIREILDDDHTVVAKKIMYFSDERTAYELEKSEIARIGLENLTNIVEGGQLSEVVIAKRFAADKERRRKAIEKQKISIRDLAVQSAPYFFGIFDLHLANGVKFSREDLNQVRRIFESDGIKIEYSMLDEWEQRFKVNLPQRPAEAA